MRAFARPLLFGALLTSVPAGLARAQSFRINVVNTRREISANLWGGSSWLALTVDEEDRDLNRDSDTDDTLLVLVDLRSMSAIETGIAVNDTLGDEQDDRVVAFSGDLVAIQVSESDNGARDLNGDGRAESDVLHLYSAATKKLVNLGLVGRNPTFHAGRLYFSQPEVSAKKDLNGDGDTADVVLSSCDLTGGDIQSLGMDASGGFQAAGDWIVASASEASQGNKDANGDGDSRDLVAQLYQLSQKKWTNTALDASADLRLTPKLLALGVEEESQGNQDWNHDMDREDIVCFVWDLAAGKAINTGLDCGDGLAADGDLAGLAVGEAAQGDVDLNGDGDQEDSVAHAFVLGAAKPVNLRYDTAGGLAAGGGRLALVCSEADQGDRDLNRDNDREDYVLVTYDSDANRIGSTGHSVDGDLYALGARVAWRMLEADQGNRDLNRDNDSDDAVLFVMNLATGAVAPTSYAATDYVVMTDRGVGFGCAEADQGDRDLNFDMDTEDEVLLVARWSG